MPTSVLPRSRIGPQVGSFGVVPFLACSFFVLFSCSTRIRFTCSSCFSFNSSSRFSTKWSRFGGASRAAARSPYRGLFPSPPLFDRMPTYRTQGKRSLNFLSAQGQWNRAWSIPCPSVRSPSCGDFARADRGAPADEHRPSGPQALLILDGVW